MNGPIPETLVIRLRPNVTFHDGEPFDAAAVKYTLERHLTLPGSFRRGEISAIDHVEVIDPLTVRLVLKSPSAPLLALLTDRAGMIVAPKAAEAAGKDFGLHPVCTGPFKFTERVAQDRIVLDRYPGYWDAANIHFDRVIYQPMTGQRGAGRQSAYRQHRSGGTGAAHRRRRGQERPQAAHRHVAGAWVSGDHLQPGAMASGRRRRSTRMCCCARRSMRRSTGRR